MNKFAERLKYLREEKNLNVVQLSKIVGFSYVAIGRWENKKRIPDIETLIVFAKYFGVTADYLLGLSDF